MAGSRRDGARQGSATAMINEARAIVRAPVHLAAFAGVKRRARERKALRNAVAFLAASRATNRRKTMEKGRALFLAFRNQRARVLGNLHPAPPLDLYNKSLSPALVHHALLPLDTAARKKRARRSDGDNIFHDNSSSTPENPIPPHRFFPSS